MSEQVRQQLVDDHFLFVSGDRNLIAAGMERDWPEGRGIFHNKDKTFLTWVNEEDQLRIISMQSGGDVRAVFDRLARGKLHSFISSEVASLSANVCVSVFNQSLFLEVHWCFNVEFLQGSLRALSRLFQDFCSLSSCSLI